MAISIGLLTIADNALANQAYFSGDKFGIADIAIAPLFYPWHEIVAAPRNLTIWNAGTSN